MEPFGVYIHYPFCRSRCDYCDFPIAVTAEPEIPHGRYLRAVLAELDARAAEFAGRELVSIYVGGGTPSLWPPAALAEAIGKVRERFPDRREPLEVTLEANPTDCAPAALAAWQSAGITRVSIGTQSFQAEELVTLGRDHRMGDGREALTRVLSGGFASASADLILGVPARGDPRERALAGAAELSALKPPHISLYELTFEPNTPLDARRRRGEIAPVDEDELAAIYCETSRLLGERGYEHYEISSFAQPGHRAVHNGLYWRGNEYLGLGSGACSFRRDPRGGGLRWRNHRSVRRYLASDDPDAQAAEVDSLSAGELAVDRIWLGLRTAEGIPEQALSERPELRRWLLDTGLARAHENSIMPTLRGFLYADQVAERAVCDRW